MDINILEVFAKTAGIGGVVIGFATIIFRQFLQQSVFSNLSSHQSFLLFRLLLIIVWSIAMTGLLIYAYIYFNIPKEIKTPSMPDAPRGDINEPTTKSREDAVTRERFTIYFGSHMEKGSDRPWPDCRNKTPMINAKLEEMKNWVLQYKGEINRIVVMASVDGVGSREYNLAFAEGCGESVANWISQLGIDSSLIEVASVGAERPKTEHISAAPMVRNLNNYAEIVIQ